MWGFGNVASSTTTSGVLAIDGLPLYAFADNPAVDVEVLVGANVTSACI